MVVPMTLFMGAMSNGSNKFKYLGVLLDDTILEGPHRIYWSQDLVKIRCSASSA